MTLSPLSPEAVTAKASRAESTASLRPPQKERAPRTPIHESTTMQEAVTLSPQANLLARAEQIMNEVPEIDWQRVEALREAIRSGQFRVHPEKIAERLVSEVEHLLQDAP